MKQQRYTMLNRSATLILRVALVALSAIVLALYIFALPAMWRGVSAEYPDITFVFYGIIAALYAAALPFFYALYQAMIVINLIDTNNAFSKRSVKALKNITLSGVVISLIFAATLPLLYVWAQHDDAPGLIVIGMLFTGASLTVSAFAAVLERLFRLR